MSQSSALSKNILVTGMQGAGKSYLAKKWKQIGLNVFDADEVKGLAAWFDSSGNTVDFNPDADELWLSNHSYEWDAQFLKKFVQMHAPLILLGASNNTFDFREFFDETYYLHVPASILEKRLTSSDRDNAFGSRAEQRRVVVERVEKSDAVVKSLGVTVIDGTLSPDKILEELKL